MSMRMRSCGVIMGSIGRSTSIRMAFAFCLGFQLSWADLEALFCGGAT